MKRTKKAFLRVLLLLCGLNVFTACYGMPPNDWLESAYLPEKQEQTKASHPDLPDEDSNVEESEGIEVADSLSGNETGNGN